jgi:hypothetical protein
MKLTWNADADLETGIKTFILYRNGAVLATLQYSATTLFSTAKGFQRWDDGDNPNPGNPPAMTYTDNNLSDAETYTYQVATVNWSDLAGAKSETLTLNKGQVVSIEGRTAARAGNRTVTAKSLLVCGASDGCMARLPAGNVALFDLGGKLLRRFEMREGGAVDLDPLLGGSHPHLILMQAF